MSETELLDSFAIAALQGYCSIDQLTDLDDKTLSEMVYDTALAMMEERKKILKKYKIEEPIVGYLSDGRNVVPVKRSELPSVPF